MKNLFFQSLTLLLMVFSSLFINDVLAGTSSSGLDNQRKSISSNSGNLCFIREDEEVVCRGEDKWDETDDGEDVYVVGISNARSISVDAGSFDEHGIWGCATTSDGSVYCWNFRNPVYKVGGIDDAVSVVTGKDGSGDENNDYACAVRANGKVKCWGKNTYGQLGNGTTNNSSTAVDVLNVTGVVALSVGSGHSTLLGRNADWVCAVRYTGGARCWGGGYSTAFAIIDLTGARQITISAARVCILREAEDGSTSVDCSLTTSKSFANFSNYMPIEDLSAPTDMASDSEYGLQCFKDESVDNEWLCRDIYYGWPVGSGYMTSLSTNVQHLQLQDGPVACAVNNSSVQCMYHGELNRPCDVAAQGEDCIDEVVQQHTGSEIGVDNIVTGTWYTIADADVYEPGEPTIFTAPSELARDSANNSSIRVSWHQGSSASSAFDVRYRRKGTFVWLTANGSRTKNGERISTNISGLQSNTQYEIIVRGKSWGSKTKYSATFTASTL